jgi:hypothetical protein
MLEAKVSDLNPFAFVGIATVIDRFRRRAEEDRIKLLVIPRYANLRADGTIQPSERRVAPCSPINEVICLEIVNRAAAGVKIARMGFVVGLHSGKRGLCEVTQPDTADGQPFARMLGSGKRMVAYCDLRRMLPNLKQAYVMTESGDMFYGRNAILDEINWRTYDPFY